MATLMIGQAETGLSHPKFVRRRASDGYWWNTAGTPAFEAYSAGNIAGYGIAAIETGATGTYTATDPADTTPGDYLLVAAAGASLAVSDVANNTRWQDAAGVTPPTAAAIADAVLDEALSGHATAGTAGAALGRIGTGVISTVSPVSQGGDITLTRGDSYYNADGRALSWTGESADVWPDLTGATITLNIGDGTLAATGSVVTPTGTQVVRCELTSAQTTTLTTGTANRVTLDYDLKATLSNTHVVTLARGKCVVTDTEGS